MRSSSTTRCSRARISATPTRERTTSRSLSDPYRVRGKGRQGSTRLKRVLSMTARPPGLRGPEGRRGDGRAEVRAHICRATASAPRRAVSSSRVRLGRDRRLMWRPSKRAAPSRRHDPYRHMRGPVALLISSPHPSHSVPGEGMKRSVAIALSVLASSVALVAAQGGSTTTAKRQNQPRNRRPAPNHLKSTWPTSRAESPRCGSRRAGSRCSSTRAVPVTATANASSR